MQPSDAIPVRLCEFFPNGTQGGPDGGLEAGLPRFNDYPFKDENSLFADARLIKIHKA